MALPQYFGPPIEPDRISVDAYGNPIRNYATGQNFDPRSTMSTVQAPRKKSFEDSLAEISPNLPRFSPIQVGSVSGLNRSDVPSVGPINSNQFGNISPETLGSINTNQFNPVTARNLEAINSSTFQPLTGFDDNYYQNLSDQASRRLQEQYFTKDDSILNQRSNELKRRGVFGDAIGENAVNSVYSSFADELADFESQLASAKAQNDIELAKYNKDFDFNVLKENREGDKFNITNTLDTSLKNRGFDFDIQKENRAGQQFNINNALDAAVKNRDLQFDVTKENRAGDQFNIKNVLDTILKNKDIETANVDRSSDAAFKNQELRNFLTDLGFKAAGDDIRASSDFDTGIFKAEVDSAKANQESLSRDMELWSNIAKDPNQNADMRRYANRAIADLSAGYQPKTYDDWTAMEAAKQPPQASAVPTQNPNRIGETFSSGRTTYIAVPGPNGRPVWAAVS